MSAAGRLLVATPQLEVGFFRRSVILICDHDAEGAIGVMLNRSSGEPVEDHLPLWSASAARPADVFIGGPVQPEVAVALAVGPASFTIEVPGFGGQVGLVDVAGDVPLGAALRIFSGYAGWSPGQLEAELSEGAWWTLEGEVADLLSDTPSELWRTVVRRQTNQVALFAGFPDQPRLN